MTQSGGGRLLPGVHFDMINGKLMGSEPVSGKFRAPAVRQDVGKNNQYLLWRAPA
jgi:hypothetical protein